MVSRPAPLHCRACLADRTTPFRYRDTRPHPQTISRCHPLRYRDAHCHPIKHSYAHPYLYPNYCPVTYFHIVTVPDRYPLTHPDADTDANQ